MTITEAAMNGISDRDSVDTSLGDLVVAIYEASMEEVHDEELARRITAALVTDVLQQQRRAGARTDLPTPAGHGLRVIAASTPRTRRRPHWSGARAQAHHQRSRGGSRRIQAALLHPNG